MPALQTGKEKGILPSDTSIGRTRRLITLTSASHSGKLICFLPHGNKPRSLPSELARSLTPYAWGSLSPYKAKSPDPLWPERAIEWERSNINAWGE